MAEALGTEKIIPDEGEFDLALFTCVICFDWYNLPRKLPCSHSFCEDCLFRYVTELNVKKELYDGVKCPVCRHINPGPETDQDLFEWVKGLAADTDHADAGGNAAARFGKLELCFSCKEAKLVGWLC